MLRSARVWNRSTEDVDLGDGRTVPALGSLTLTHAELVRLATDGDLSALPIEVRLPEQGMREASVSDFGAVGDGITDDTAAFKAAVDYIAAYGGGIVTVPVGVFVVRSVTLRGGVSMEGESREGSVLRQPVGEHAAVVSITSDGSSLHRVHIVGNRES